MSSHKDVRIWMGVSTGAPLLTQHFLYNPGLMRAMASRLHHWVFKIVLLVHTFKLCCSVCAYIQTVLAGTKLQTMLSGMYLQTASLGAYCIKSCLLVHYIQAVGQGMPLHTFKSSSLGTSCSSHGAEHVAAHLQIMSSGASHSSRGAGYVPTNTNRTTYLHPGSIQYSFHFLSSRSYSIHSLSNDEEKRLRFQFNKQQHQKSWWWTWRWVSQRKAAAGTPVATPSHLSCAVVRAGLYAMTSAARSTRPSSWPPSWWYSFFLILFSRESRNKDIENITKKILAAITKPKEVLEIRPDGKGHICPVSGVIRPGNGHSPPTPWSEGEDHHHQENRLIWRVIKDSPQSIALLPDG